MHEDNHTYIVNDHLYMDHDEETLDTIDHECDLEAYCTSCGKLLPWALYQIRDLDGVKLSDTAPIIAELMEELQDNGQAATTDA